MAKKMTPKDKEVLEAIINYIQEHGYAPTFDEIGEMTGMYSKSTVYSHVHKLFEIGALETDAEFKASRAIRVPGYKFVKENDCE